MRTIALVVIVGLTASGGTQAARAQSAPAAGGPADPLDVLLTSGELARTTNPIAAQFLLAEGAGRLPPDAERRAREQLLRALQSQTNPFRLMAQGVAGIISTDSYQQAMKQAQSAMAAGGIKQAAGIGGSVPTVDAYRMQQDVRGAMVDPWVRGIESARALDRAGETRAATSFYVNCLQMLQAKWVPGICLQSILDLGATRAELVLTWMLDNADSISITNTSSFAPPQKAKNAPLDQGTVQLRNSALEGLGALVGSGGLDGPVRERVMTKLLAFANGKENEPFFQGAAEGLARSKDPRAVEPLRRLSHVRGTAELRLSAWRGLAVGFRDPAAIREIRGMLEDKDPDEQLRASQALYEIGDEAAFRWAVDTIGRRRSSDSAKPDLRSQIVRDLVELGGPPARETLARALAAGAGNDWLDAWVAIGLLELGDTTQLPRVEQALRKTDWALDPRGFASIWRSISPMVGLVAGMVLSSGAMAMQPSTYEQVKRVVQVVGNFAVGERERYLAKAGQREAATARLRWQAADALAASHPPGTAKLLDALLDDPALPVRAGAAHALARLDDPEAMRGIARAYTLDYGAENNVSRTPAVRAALLRALLLRFPAAPDTGRLVAAAREDSDAALRVMALAASADPR